MPRRQLKKVLPSAEYIRGLWGVSWFAHWIGNPNLWHVNRRSISLGVAIGIFFAFVPLPIQTVGAVCVAILIHANLPLSVALVWISNPLTFVPIYGAAYIVGAWLLGVSVVPFSELTTTIIGQNIAALWLGCMLLGALLAAIGAVLTYMYWNWYVRSSWAARRKQRQALKKAARSS